MRNDSSEQRIRRLEDDLYLARRALLDLLPPEIEVRARSYYGIGSREDAHTWEAELVQAVIDRAWPLAEKTFYSGPRAYCPLCRGGSSGPYDEGFALPVGLYRHLLGAGNAHACPVLTQIRELAHGYWGPRIAEAEERERAQKAAEMERRRGTEDRYLVDPRSGPLLRDEHVYGARDDASLAWAIERLTTLGFVETRDERIRRFTKDAGSVVVYADPREQGRLNFNVLRREQVENPKARRRWMPDHANFYLLDSWRKNLRTKVDEQIDGARASLERSTRKTAK